MSLLAATIWVPLLVGANVHAGAPVSGFARFAQAPTAKLSGAAWWKANQAKFPNSTRVEDLAPDFRSCPFNVVLTSAILYTNPR